VAENRGAVALVKRLAGFPAGDCCGESLTAPTVERETLRRLVVGSGQRVSLGRAISDDWPRIGNLLERSKLSPDGLKPWLMNTIVGLVGDEVVAVAAFEMYGDAGLLRSWRSSRISGDGGSGPSSSGWWKSWPPSGG